MTDSPRQIGAGQIAVNAAGAVLWREHGRDVQVAVVHRPRHDDWSLPKGKLDAGETVQACAAREVAEETGYRAVLGRHLGITVYPVSTPDGHSELKRVDYFAARAVAGGFESNHEVDRLRWLSPQDAAELLSYDRDRDILHTFTLAPAATKTLLLVRHAKAGKRREWDSDDDLRPLSSAGRKQAKELAKLLPLYGVDSVYSAPRVRCLQTVEPFAEEKGLKVAEEPLLSEEGYWPDQEAGVARLLEITTNSGTPVVSSQGGVIPDVVARLAVANELVLEHIKSRKGSTWVLSFDIGTKRPKLVAADYIAPLA